MTSVDPGEGRTHASAELLASMGELLAAIRAVTIDLEAPDADVARTTRDELADQVSDYILPRLVQLDAPLLTVIGGSTGAGKSTLVNSLVGEAVSTAGVLRPTTRSPMLIHHPDDTEWFAQDRLLPDLDRVGADEASSVYGLQLVRTEAIPAGLALLDAPDVDSVDEVNRDLAAQLLAAADLWLFVTSAARYADQVPWEYLRRSAERATSLAVVLDRTAPEAIEEVRGHLARMMTSRGLSDSPLFTVPEADLTPQGLLPEESIASIRGWLHDLAADPTARRMIVGRTLDGAVRHVVLRSHDVADAIDAQVEVATKLFGGATAGYDQAVEQVGLRTSDGSLMAGELLGRWQRLVASGDLVAAFAGSGDDAGLVVEAADTAISSLVVDAAERVAEHVAKQWVETPSGAERVATHGVDRASSQVRAGARSLVEAWRGAVTDRLRETSPDTAGALALAVVVEVLLSDAGRRDGMSSAGRRALEGALGADAVDDVVRSAHADLVERVRVLLDRDRSRMLALVDDPAVLAEQQQAVRDAARQVEIARHLDFLNGGLSA